MKQFNNDFMFEIIPGILEKDWTEIERKIEIVKPFASAIHIDIIDGKFAPNTTFLDPTPFKKFTSDMFFELHMMVEEPINYIKPFADAGFRRFIGHIEKMLNQEEFVAQGQLLGEVGLAIDGQTSIDAIKVPYFDLDCVLVMDIKAGFSGQQMIPENIEKVKFLKQIQDDNGIPLPIEVDGGINDQAILAAKNAGANRFVTTSFLFNGDPSNNYHLLQESLTK